MNKENDKKIYEFALNCALKGIDIEDTINSAWNSIKELIEPVIELTNKNYQFLSSCKKVGDKE